MIIHEKHWSDLLHVQHEIEIVLEYCWAWSIEFPGGCGPYCICISWVNVIPSTMWMPLQKVYAMQPHTTTLLCIIFLSFFPPLIFQYFVFSLSNDIHSIHQHNVRFHEGKQTFSFSFLPMENRIIITVMIMRIAWEFWIFIIYVLAEEWRT